MKELSIKEKAKAYDEVLEKANALYKAAEPMSGCNVILETLFPELVNSEDEKIRKMIINHLTQERGSLSSTEAADAIAWLDKQGEQKPNPYTGTSFEYNGHNWGMCARDNGVEILFDGELKAFISSEKSFIYPIHPQPSLIPKSTQETISKEKVERQFRVGDWVVNNRSKDIFLIKGINSGYCTLEDIKGNIISPCLPQCESESHLWTIQDAKDGDVLAGNYGTFIFMSKSDGYCGVLNDNTFIRSTGNNEWTEGLHPATKEQRDLLFKEMKEAGYEWNVEKKKLKNIKNEIEIPFGANDSELQEVTYYIPKGFNAEIDDDKVVIKKGEKPTAWSEEDNKIIEEIINDIECARAINYHAPKESYKFRENWLKSIKDRMQLQPKQECSEEDLYKVESALFGSYAADVASKLLNRLISLRPQNTWKPSDVQIHAFEQVYDWYNDNFAPSETLTSLYNDLKKLKGE